MTFDHLRDAIREYSRQAQNWTLNLNKSELSNPILVRILNDQLMQVEKIFLSPGGIPMQNSTNHIILSMKGGSHHGQAIFPGILNLLQDFLQLNDQERTNWTGWEILRRHVTQIYVKILQAASHLKDHHII